MHTATITKEGKIKMTKYNPKHMQYVSDSKGEQLAVFSEIYYPEGWKAYIDGIETEILKANYLLRALKIPSGKHKIEFKFDLPKYRFANTSNLVLSVLLVLAFVVAGFWQWKKNKKNVETVTSQGQ